MGQKLTTFQKQKLINSVVSILSEHVKDWEFEPPETMIDLRLHIHVNFQDNNVTTIDRTEK